MRDLIGYLKKTVYLSSLVLFFVLPISHIHAKENFKINTLFEHTITDTTISTEIVLQISADTPRVISYYTASLPIKGLNTKCYLVKTGKKIECTNYHRGSNTDVLFELNNSVVKPDIPLEIKITYEMKTDLEDAYNISSKVLDTTTNSVIIKYPKEKGEPLWTSDPLSNIKLVNESYLVTINKPVYQSISLLFGRSILYEFSISRTFQNSTTENQTFELVIPPDTKDQSIIWGEISPLPNSSIIDDDGNYIFKYLVQPEKTVDCKIDGYIEKLVSTESQTLKSYLTKETGYWKVVNTSESKRVQSYMSKKGVVLPDNFEDVEELDSINKELFYKHIYKYIVEKLSIEKDLQLGIENAARLGAETLVESPQNAKPLDYADFYIALLRKYNVPSRLVIGYVSKISGYTSDGFYHYWVEYFDSSKNRWITADPFLEDYLEKDLYKNDFYDHITVLRRGKSTVSPNVTFYSENDFTVEFVSESKLEKNFNPNAELYFEELKSTDSHLKGYLYIINNGNIAVTSSSILSSNIADLRKYIDPVNNITSQVILPKQNATIQLNIPYSKILSTNVFVNFKLENSSVYNKELVVEQNVIESTPLFILLLSKLLSMLIFFLFVFLIYFVSNKLKKNG